LGGAMQTYPVKPGHAAKTDLKMLFEAAFDAVREEDGWLVGAFGTMPTIKARYEGKNELVVDTVTDKTFAVKMAQGDAQAGEVAKETHSRWNDFLEGATGYDAKTRSKKIQEAAKKDKDAKEAAAAKLLQK
jgi:hypothetical protein